jgi:hypothetical protein
LIQQIIHTQNLSNSLKPNNSQKTSSPTKLFVTRSTPSQKTRPNKTNPILYIGCHIPIIETFYTISTRFLLILGGDIELNLGPIYNLLRYHPPDHKQRSKTYFTLCTIQLKPEYQQPASTFEPYLITTYPNHQDTQRTHIFLNRFISSHTQYPSPLFSYIHL